MASSASATRLSHQSLLGLAVAVSLITSAWVPAAIAKPDHGRSTPNTQAPHDAEAGPHGEQARGEHAHGEHGDTPAASSPGTPAAAGKGHDERAAASGPAPPAPDNPAARPHAEGGGKAEACCAARPRSAPSAPTKQQRGHEHASRRQADGRASVPRHADRPSQVTGGHEQEAVTSPVASRPPHDKGKHDKKVREPKHPRPAPTPVGSAGAPAAKTAPATVTSSPPLAAPPAPALVSPPTITPTATTPPRILSESKPTVTGGHSRRPGPHRAGVPRRRPAPGALAPGRLAPTAGHLATSAPAALAKRARTATPSSPARHAQSPLVTTVTRIIGVVPAAVWILIGLLVALALALGANSRLVAMGARRLARQRRELLEDVGLLQAALLPVLPGRLGPVGTSAAYRPASGPGAGGDFYDVFALGDGQLAVIVGDVSGHGREALPHTSLVRFTLRAYLEAGLSPRSALQTAAPVLERQLGDSFATVVLATYHPRDRILTYACAGHPPPVVTGTRSIAPITVCSSPPIGVGQTTGMRQTVVFLPGRSLACFYTDGVIEARVGGELFGAGRLERTLAELGPDATAPALLDRVAAETERRPDDMAACLLRVEGDPCEPTVQVEELELDRREAARDRAERFLLAGGVDPGEVAKVIGSVQTAVARHGGIVLELHLGDGPPEVALREHNVARLHPPAQETAQALGMSR
jgi:serine phosphatase RsbU (regulator of sigma subunit)